MTGYLDALFPRYANNEYRGGAVTFYGYCVLFATEIFSATVHFLTPDGGKQSIASIIVLEGNPDPNPVAHMYASIAGVHDMLLALLGGLVLWRYRNLIPLMLVLSLSVMVLGVAISTSHPLTPEYFEHTPPAMFVRVPKFLVLSGLLFLALRQTVRSSASPPATEADGPPVALELILPANAGNTHDRGDVPLYGFCILAAAMFLRAAVHLLSDDSGVNSIASIVEFDGYPDPNNLIYLFSAVGGTKQMAFVLLYAVVLWRYRSLIPLMFAFLIIEACFGFVVTALHPLDPIYYEHVPPRQFADLPMLAFGIAMLFLSIRNREPLRARTLKRDL